MMPVLAMFYGIIIRMYLMEGSQHHRPHIHARYGEFEAAIDIEEGELLAGELPRKQLRLVQAWIELRRDELLANWELAQQGIPPYRIDPL
ncbi:MULTISPECIES: DUF4160 domain-containing protein [Hydrogenophilus]|jgi:hypothetical protein|uniref:DUF4160 domain-containing protein n=1 Tax=Hydrogenophilus thermoluteolus TaxID=297 RepID=A0A2Z6DV02_HYDTE|nr:MULTISPECIES: DUF4160 domain-containing protein [Hydrogenophilus]BBD76274.1 hypothetical protein HPTL_0004 [Hydrogenophilus thermoluteolus]GLW60508.1 hypothetical protein Hthe01_08570 [Hydrogenophilus thermoluteolus]HNQ47923.1 DUF4160 domain-containing protein [Hydrogenophilus thermoluteolus]HNU19695.1 DUF4160 domain-containing protein [Hydrogenophilus thermoluteolus]